MLTIPSSFASFLLSQLHPLLMRVSLNHLEANPARARAGAVWVLLEGLVFSFRESKGT